MAVGNRSRPKLSDAHKAAVEAVLQDVLGLITSRGIKAFITRRGELRNGTRPAGKRWKGFRYDDLPEKIAWVAARTSAMKYADELIRPS